jgi:transketolase
VTAVAALEERAREIRRIAVALIHEAQSGHPGGCLSAADILAALYFHVLDVSPETHGRPDVDRFVLSKGHACPALYGALSLRGFFPAEELGSFRQLHGLLQGSPTTTIPGVDATCGSLGQGFSIAVGIALGKRKLGQAGRVYVMLGDGELQEGQVWEAAMAAAHHRLDTLCAIVDYNKMQSDAPNEQIMGLEPLRPKWEAFGWKVVEVDGHDLSALLDAFDAAAATVGQPSVIIAHTVKGSGVSYMAGVPSWHGSVALRDEEFERALADLGVAGDDLGRYRFRG